MATVTVRIPVAVSYDGHVVAESAHRRMDSQGYEAAVSRLAAYAAKFPMCGYHIMTITVSLPIPTEIEVIGKCSEGESEPGEGE